MNQNHALILLPVRFPAVSKILIFCVGLSGSCRFPVAVANNLERGRVHCVHPPSVPPCRLQKLSFLMSQSGQEKHPAQYSRQTRVKRSVGVSGVAGTACPTVPRPTCSVPPHWDTFFPCNTLIAKAFMSIFGWCPTVPFSRHGTSGTVLFRLMTAPP